jgi:TPR repeat protein
MQDDGTALAEGFYWYAEKLMWGYEGTTKNPAEALRLYRQSAALGFSDAHIRIGELLEYGKGTKANPNDALVSYQKATKAGNFLAYAFIAKLISRTKHRSRADRFWQKFFDALAADSNPKFLAERPGGLIHAYLDAQLSVGQTPGYLDLVREHQMDVIIHHMHLLEHAGSDEQLHRLDRVSKWMVKNFVGSAIR